MITRLKQSIDGCFHLLFIGVALCGVLTGCESNHPPSKAWMEAEASLAHEEWVYTNQMKWPAMVGPVEVVMTPGMCITAISLESSMSVTAGEGYARQYTWDGATRSATLWPRKSRWYGGLGIYFPGPGEHWESNGGITRGVLEEGILWFGTTNDATNWIQKNLSSGNVVYSDDGLLVAWDKVPARKQINVDV